MIKKILKENDNIIIAIGSAEKSHTNRNPFTASERKKIISETLKAEKIDSKRYKIIPVEDINNESLWVNHVNKHVPTYETIYTGSSEVKRCYFGKPYKLVKIKKTIPLSATLIRKYIRNGSKEWEPMVHKKTKEIINTIINENKSKHF